ncbi:unnamed protein product, partial [Ixodes pacificus]
MFLQTLRGIFPMSVLKLQNLPARFQMIKNFVRKSEVATTLARHQVVLTSYEMVPQVRQGASSSTKIGGRLRDVLTTPRTVGTADPVVGHRQHRPGNAERQSVSKHFVVIQRAPSGLVAQNAPVAAQTVEVAASWIDRCLGDQAAETTDDVTVQGAQKLKRSPVQEGRKTDEHSGFLRDLVFRRHLGHN